MELRGCHTGLFQEEDTQTAVKQNLIAINVKELLRRQSMERDGLKKEYDAKDASLKNKRDAKDASLKNEREAKAAALKQKHEAEMDELLVRSSLKHKSSADSETQPKIPKID